MTTGAKTAKLTANRVYHFIKKHLKSGYFYGNSKTNASVDFRVCPLMSWNGESYTSKVCESCYSAHLLSLYRDTRAKLENAPSFSDWRLKLFLQDCKKLKERFGFEKIRFYALGDFGPEDIPYIVAASHFFTVDILSKTLAMPKFQQHLTALINEPNVWVSLSFNNNFNKRMRPLAELMKQKRATNVQFNYTLNCRKEDPHDEKFRNVTVFHPRNRNRRELVDMRIPEERVCGIWDIDGEPVDNHGHCQLCTNCHVSLLETQRTNLFA
jgi:hypothetical protein